jgi:hypothetical protein
VRQNSEGFSKLVARKAINLNRFLLIVALLPFATFGQQREIVSIEGIVYPKTELPFRIQNHLVLTQTGVCVGFFLANSDIVYGVKSGLPVGYLAADGFLHFSFPSK